MKNKFVVGSLVLVIIVFLFVSIFRGSYANEEMDTIKLDLFYNTNEEIFKDEIKNFIDLIDENIIVNSSFNLSDVLNENYDFLTRFVISFVLDNQEYFDIVYGNNYIYEDEYGRRFTTNKYISVDTLYDITNKIFGVEYYYVLDRNLVVNEMVVLVDFPDNDREINMEIDNINYVDVGNGNYDVYVGYIDYEFDYVYTFNIIDDNRLVISNLSIGE